MPGILQSPFLNRIGGSSRVRSDLAAALGEGRALVDWYHTSDDLYTDRSHHSTATSVAWRLHFDRAFNY